MSSDKSEKALSSGQEGGTSERLIKLCQSEDWEGALAELAAGAPLDEAFKAAQTKGARNHARPLSLSIFVKSGYLRSGLAEQEKAPRVQELTWALLSRDPSLANARFDDGRPILTVAAQMGSYELCEALLRHGADPNGGVAEGFASPLRLASGKKVDIVTLLLEFGALAERSWESEPGRSDPTTLPGSPKRVAIESWIQKTELSQALVKPEPGARAVKKSL